MCDLDNRATWHVSCDRACTRIEVTQLREYVDERSSPLEAHSLKSKKMMVIQEDQDGDLGL